MGKIKLAVVDDYVILRKAIISELQKEPNFEITLEASNGKLFLNEVSSTAVDLVILDIQMPVMNGLETLAKLKKLHPEIKVIMYSSYADEQMTTQLFSLGADAVMSKTADFAFLVRSISEIFEGKTKLEEGIGVLS